MKKIIAWVVIALLFLPLNFTLQSTFADDPPESDAGIVEIPIDDDESRVPGSVSGADSAFNEDDDPDGLSFPRIGEAEGDHGLDAEPTASQSHGNDDYGDEAELIEDVPDIYALDDVNLDALDDGVPYIDASGVTQFMPESGVTVLTAGTGTLTNGWYMLRGTVTAAGMLTISGAVNLILEDGCVWTADGIIVNAGDSLTIYAQSAVSGMGSLTATGGDYAAGIGGGQNNVGGNITINGGTVTATGGTNGAGIGGGRSGSGGRITINGGNITATGGEHGAGIGGGYDNSGGSISIGGGTVTATGGANSAGIGGGQYGAGGTITISDGMITVKGGIYASGIGGGSSGSAGTITINGGTVDATGNDFGAGIGGAQGDGIIKIGGGDINATGGDNGAGIGGSQGNAGGNITIKDGIVAATGGSSASGIGGGQGNAGGTITIDGGSVTATGGGSAAGIGGGYRGSGGGTITINKGTVNATGGVDSAGIGGGYQGNGGTITIGGGDVTVTGGSAGAGIGGGWDGAGGTITINGGEVNATGGSAGAGIGGGYNRGGGDITISAGEVNATGGDYAAGIGGGRGRDGGTFIINGGTITATGGNFGAGIGGGYQGAGGNITIGGGTVNASGTNGGAGIGGGNYGDGGTFIINGGTITATGGGSAAGIGGGNYGMNGDITIGGGTVTAEGGYFGAGIGNGFLGAGGTITISGGEVIAKGGYCGAGIGGGNSGNGGTIEIGGGTITAEGGLYGAGIGGGIYGEGNITINNGTVNATGGTNGAGIGSGQDGDGGTVVINGGMVNATGGYGGADIGSGFNGYDGTVTIDGGSIKASSFSPAPKNSEGVSVSLNTLTLDGVDEVTTITAGIIDSIDCDDTPDAENGVYGIRGVKTDGDGKVYFYISYTFVPSISLTTAAGEYENSDTANLNILYLKTPTVPMVVDVSPARGATGVAISGAISIEFSEVMDTIAGGTVQLNDLAPLTDGGWIRPGKYYWVSYTGLSYNTEYTVNISGFQSTDGTAMAAVPSGYYKFTTTTGTGKTSVINTGGAATVTYGGIAIDLSTVSGLFNIDPNAGAETYSIETSGSPTGVGMIGADGKMLTVTKAGTFTIGLVTAETDTYATGVKVTATLTVNKASPLTPAGLGKTDVTTYGGNDGMITGLAANTVYEYKKDGGNYIAATSNASGNITGLTAGSYVVRFAETDLYNASADSEAVVIGQPPAATYGISLSVSGTHIFAGATYGYDSVAAQSVTITNTGNQATGELSIALSGANASGFELSSSSLSSIAVDGTRSFTIKPKDGLTAGTYTATVTVSGDINITPVSFGASFTVNKATLTFKADDKTITIPEAAPTYTYTLSGLAGGDTEAEVVQTSPTLACSGTVNIAGTYDITVSGAVLTSSADAKGANYEIAYETGTLTVNPTPGIAPTITTVTLANGTVGTAYTETLSATGDATITWSVTSGDLPDGLSLTPYGVIYGTPTTAGTFYFIAEAANGVAPNATKVLSVTIDAASIAVTGITLNQTNLSLYSNTSPNTAVLTATVYPPGATDKTAVWVSGNTSVATVDQSGNVTAVANGTALITVTTTDGGFTASCTVTVSTYSIGSGDGSGNGSGSGDGGAGSGNGSGGDGDNGDGGDGGGTTLTTPTLTRPATPTTPDTPVVPTPENPPANTDGGATVSEPEVPEGNTPIADTETPLATEDGIGGVPLWVLIAIGGVIVIGGVVGLVLRGRRSHTGE